VRPDAHEPADGHAAAAVDGREGVHRGPLADLDDALNVAPGDGSLLVARAEVYSSLHKAERALADLNRALAQQPENAVRRFWAVVLGAIGW